MFKAVKKNVPTIRKFEVTKASNNRIMKTLGIKYTDSVWKNRHRASQKSKKYLKKQLSRKAAQLDRYRQENILLKKRLQTAEKALLKLPPNAPNRFGQSGVAVPQGHKYGLWLVCMCI